MTTGEWYAQVAAKWFGKKLLVICGKERRPNRKGESSLFKPSDVEAVLSAAS